ncbi:MAG: T9SS type B sorting domain-containing protein [Flavobacteriales bacterium]
MLKKIASLFFLLFFAKSIKAQTFEFNLGADTTLCDGDYLYISYLGLDVDYYLWEDSTETGAHLITETGLYWLEMSYQEQIFRDSIFVDFITPTPFNYPDTQICGQDFIVLHVDLDELDADSAIWNNNLNQDSLLIDEEGVYVVEIFTQFCSIIDSIDVGFYASGIGYFPDTFYLCEDESINLNVFPADSVLWSTGSTDFQFNSSTEGSFWVDIYHDCTYSRDSFDIVPLEDQLQISDTLILCQDAFYNLGQTNPLFDIYWSTGDDGDSVLIDESGTYWACLEYEDCSYCDTFEVFLYTKPDFNLQESYTICPGESIELTFPEEYVVYWNGIHEVTSVIIDQEGYFIVEVPDSFCYFVYGINVYEGICDHELLGFPNVFTPNGNEFHEYLHPINPSQFAEYRIRVYARWGILLYDGNQEEKGWDGKYEGKDCNPGEYYVIWDYKFEDSKWYSFTANVTLFR